jgi:hypothetical protein
MLADPGYKGRWEAKLERYRKQGIKPHEGAVQRAGLSCSRGTNLAARWMLLGSALIDNSVIG